MFDTIRNICAMRVCVLWRFSTRLEEIKKSRKVGYLCYNTTIYDRKGNTINDVTVFQV